MCVLVVFDRDNTDVTGNEICIKLCVAVALTQETVSGLEVTSSASVQNVF